MEKRWTLHYSRMWHRYRIHSCALGDSALCPGHVKWFSWEGSTAGPCYHFWGFWMVPSTCELKTCMTHGFYQRFHQIYCLEGWADSHETSYLDNSTPGSWISSLNSVCKKLTLYINFFMNAVNLTRKQNNSCTSPGLLCLQDYYPSTCSQRGAVPLLKTDNAPSLFVNLVLSPMPYSGYLLQRNVILGMLVIGCFKMVLFFRFLLESKISEEPVTANNLIGEEWRMLLTFLWNE